MLEGLEISEIVRSGLEYSKRLDSEYYRPVFLKYEELLQHKKAIPLKDIATFLIGPFGSAFTVENYTEDKTYRYMRGKDVKPMKIMDDDNVYMPKSDFERLSKYALKENDILLSVVGTLGNAAIIQKENTPSIFSCKSTVIRVSGVNPFYLLAYINSSYGRSLLLRKERGAVQKGLNLDDVKTLNVYLANNQIQQLIERIFKLSVEIDKKAKSTYTAAETLLLQTLGLANFSPNPEKVNIKSFKDSFGTSGRLDAEYYQSFYEQFEAIIKTNTFVLLDDICSDINYGTVPTSPYTEDGSGIPYIKGMNIKNCMISGEFDRIEGTEELKERFYTKEGDIIISQMGTVGDVGVVNKEQEGWLFASFTIRARLKRNTNFNPYFVGFYIQNLAKPYYLMRNIAQASVRQNTDLPTIRSIYIPTVKLDRQQEIANLIQQSFTLKAQSEHLLEVAKRAVEIAIEQDEQTAMDYINANTSSTSV